MQLRPKNFLGILADALEMRLDSHSWKHGLGLNACLGRESIVVTKSCSLSQATTSTHARVG